VWDGWDKTVIQYLTERRRGRRHYGSRWLGARNTWPVCSHSESGGRKVVPRPQHWTMTSLCGVDSDGRSHASAVAAWTSEWLGWYSRGALLRTTRKETGRMPQTERILYVTCPSTAHHRQNNKIVSLLRDSNQFYIPDTHSLTAALDRLRVVAMSKTSGPGLQIDRHWWVGPYVLPSSKFSVDGPVDASSQWQEVCRWRRQWIDVMVVKLGNRQMWPNRYEKVKTKNIDISCSVKSLSVPHGRH